MLCRPVNLIHETKDRWVYAIAFGALTEQFLQLILEGNLLSVIDYSATTIVKNVFKGNMHLYAKICLWLMVIWQVLYC